MKKSWKRWLAGALCLTLALPTAAPALAEEAEELPAEIESQEQASTLSITVGDYTPTMRGSENIRGGERYTLIALPLVWCEDYGDEDVSTLTAQELVASSSQALFIGSAVAGADGQVTFEDVRLRTADAAVYYVTGPGLDKPLYEATSQSTQASGKVLTDSADSSASITLVDSETRYHYGNSALTDRAGIFSFDNVAPGSYTARITKPGYLPYTQQVNIVDSRTTILNFNISSANSGLNNPAHYQVGDVDNNGARDMADLAAILRYYGQVAPQGVTADLNADGGIDDGDARLLITAAGMTNPKDITTGTATDVTGAKLTVKDSGAAAGAALRSLSVGAETTATVSAAAFSITYRSDAIQPMNASGGLISPVDGSAVANCLVPASGVAARLIEWQVGEELVTLSFALTCDRPKAAGELARFYYRPVSGSTENLYTGAIALDHAVAVVGKDTVVTDHALTYPSQEEVTITALTIDQQPAAGETVSLTIPAAGRTAALPLSVTGHSGATSYPDLTGVTWSLARADGESLAGISVERGALTITSEVVAGSVELTASRDSINSPPLTVELTNAEPVATTIQILKDGQAVATDVARGYTGGLGWCPQYTAKVYDQYGVELGEQPAVTWSLVGAPAWLTVEDGLVTYARDVYPAGTWSFTVVAEAQGLQAALELELTLWTYSSDIDIHVVGPARVAIPNEDEDPIDYHYTVFARELNGRLRDLSGEEVTLGPSYDDGYHVEEFTREMDGSFTMTVPPLRSGPSAPSYEVVWYDASGNVNAEGLMGFSKYSRKTDTDAVQAAIFYEGEAVRSLHLSVPAGEAREFQFEAKMLDREGAIAKDQPRPEEWYWSDGFIANGIYFDFANDGKLTVENTAKPGIYAGYVHLAEPFGEEGPIKWTYSVPITLEIVPQLSGLKLAAPERLTIPTQEELRYILVAEGQDADGNVMELPDDLTWSVTAKGGAGAPSGVSVENGVLHITPAAAPGALTVTVSDAGGTITSSADIVLAPAGSETSLLVLYREVRVGGQTVQKLEPVTLSGDMLNVREGQGVEVRYTAMLVNQTTGAATALRADQVKWLGGGSVFTVDAATEPGVYSRNLTAVYGGQAVSAAATVEVYYDIAGLTLDFGDGKDAPPYEFTVPHRLSRTYTATLMAKIRRRGQIQSVPIRELELRGYDLSMITALTGLYATVDKSSGTMTFTIDPAALNNPTSAPTNGDYDVRFIRLLLDYFPGEEDYFDLDFRLTPDTTRVTQALLRRGVGQGVSFSFDSPKTDEVTTAQGTLTNCYAMELLDQYNLPVTDETVTWELTVPDALVHGEQRYVSMVDPGEHITGNYPRYASIRRLQVDPDAPPGSYELKLTAKAAGLTCTKTISLTIVANHDQEDLTLELTGSSMIVIPMYYARYNDTVLNNAVNSESYVAVLHHQDSGSYEEDLSNYNVTWSVTDPEGMTPVGVSVRGSGGGGIGTVVVDRTAQPTGEQKNKRLTVTAMVTLEDRVVSASVPVELSRDLAIPTLMRIRKNGSYVANDSVSMQSTDKTRTLEYTFDLVDQYNRPVEQQHLSQVQWELTGSTGSVAALQKVEQNGVTKARVTITNPGSRVSRTVYLTATINVAEPLAPGGIQAVSARVAIAISIAGTDNGGGGGNNGGGAEGPGETVAGAPATMSISGNAAVTTAQGTAASRTYGVVLRDKNGNTCALSEQQKVKWSASGLSGGLSFDSASHTLSVPANALVGTYTVHITAQYSSSVQAAINVTVTVTAKDDPQQEVQTGQNTTPTIVPVVTQTGTAGSATLTAEQEKALTGSTATGGTVTVAPSGGSGLTSISVNLTAATVSALANQKNQSLKVQTNLGTVVLPPAALKGLAGQGGNTVTVKLSSSGGVLQADFICGSAVGTLPTAVALSAPTSGNLAVRVNGDGSETILKKAVVQNGRVLTYLSGSTQLKVESRSPAFSDTAEHWAREAITFTAARELFQGTSATTFAPNDTMTRSMLVTVLHRLEDTPSATATAHFADVVQGSWYTNAVDWANASGIVQGTDQGFQPDAPVTREQLATILYRYASTMGLTTSQRASLSGFSDRGKVSGWAQDAVQWAVGVGLINGKTGGVLDPTGNASRAEVSTILQRLIVYMAPTV